jgi:soluble lytic murein transglycosylase-like protein
MKLKYILFLALILPFNIATSSYQDKSLNGLYREIAKNNNINANLLKAVCEIESKHNLKVKKVWDGGSYSYGICQVKLGTARFLGFKGKEAELIEPKTNIDYAAKYLAYQLKRYKGDYKKAIVSYNRGSYNKDETMTYSGKVALAYLIESMKGKRQ